MLRFLFPTLLIAALIATACGVTISAPTPGPDMTDQITVPAPSSGAARLTISFGAGKLSLSPGAGGLVEGTAVYNLKDLKPEIITTGNSVEIRQGSFKSFTYPGNLKNEWNLRLGSTPMDLTIKAGAYDAEYEFD